MNSVGEPSTPSAMVTGDYEEELKCYTVLVTTNFGSDVTKKMKSFVYMKTMFKSHASSSGTVNICIP